MDYEEGFKYAKDIAKEAGELMLYYFRNSNKNAEEKSDRTIVTVADTKINKLVIDKITHKYPNHSIWGEEEKVIKDDSEFTWVCDPIDGTMPFAKSIPISTFSLAFVDAYGKSVFGVCYDPYQDRMYSAMRGAGAYMNEESICVSQVESLHDSYVDLELWLNEEEGVEFDDPRQAVVRTGARATSLCSAVITGCLTAEGKFEAMVFGQAKPEDIAAISVIVEEAGGKVTDLLGNNQRYDRNIIGAIVSNGKIHDELVEIMSSINYRNKYLE